jgi:hypothetical protein
MEFEGNAWPRSRRPNNHQINRAGRHLVAAQLYLRGAKNVVVGVKRSEPDVRASDPSNTRQVTLKVKAKTAGDWQASIDSGVPRQEVEHPTEFWVLVDLSNPVSAWFVMPAWWIENNIFEVHRAYLGRHGGHRAITDSSKHHSLEEGRVQQWRNCWSLLGIFGE